MNTMAGPNAHADRGIGFTLILSSIAIGGAVLMYATPDTPLAGWGFALAMVAASLAVVAASVYG